MFCAWALALGSSSPAQAQPTANKDAKKIVLTSLRETNKDSLLKSGFLTDLDRISLLPEPTPSPQAGWSSDPNDKRPQKEQTTPAGEILLIRAERFRRDGKILICEGNVTTEVSGIRLDCQKLEYDTQTGFAKARKDCIFFWGDNFAASQEVDLDTQNRTALMRKVAGKGAELATGSRQTEQSLFFYADELRWTPDKAELTTATITTCDEVPQDWHYKLEASKIDIYPRQRLDATGGALTLGTQRLFTLPTISLSLDPSRSVWQDFIPTFGYSGVFGAFVRTRLPFHFDSRNFGKIHLDYYTRTGLAGGIEGQFTLGNRGGGSIFYYRQGGVQSTAGRMDMRASLGYAIDEYTNIGFSYGQNQFELPGVVSPLNVGTSFAISRYAPGNAFQASTFYSRSGDNTNTGYRLFYEADLSERTSVLLSGDYAEASTLATKTHRFHYLASVLHRGDWFDMDLSAENTGGQSTYFVNRNPELRFRTHPLYLGDVPVLASFAYGDITEFPSECRTTRGDLRLTIPDQTVDWESGRMYAGAGFKEFFYGNGQNQTVVTARTSLMQNFNDNMLGRLDFNYQSPSGSTPFLTDFHYPYQSLTGGLEFYNTGEFRLSAYGGYDFYRNVTHDIMGRADYALGPGWAVSTGTNFDPGQGQFRSVDNQLSIQLTDNIYISHWAVYDFQQQKLSYQDFLINFAEHDWDASLAYRGVQNEVFFQFALKAFPSPKVQIGPSTNLPILPQNLPNAFVRN